MVGEDDSVAVTEFGDHLAEREAGTHPVDVGEAFTECLGHDAGALRVIGERADGVGVDMIDVRVRQEGVEEGLDRRASRPGIHQGARHEVGHLLVGHGVSAQKWQQVVEPQRRVVGCARAAHVRARSLDPHDPLLATEVVDKHALGRGVAPAVHNQ